MPLSGKKPPPLTIVASTLSYALQRSRPPCVSRIEARSLFIETSVHLPVRERGRNWVSTRTRALSRSWRTVKRQFGFLSRRAFTGFYNPGGDHLRQHLSAPNIVGAKARRKHPKFKY